MNHMGINHGRIYVLVSQQLLNDPDIMSRYLLYLPIRDAFIGIKRIGIFFNLFRINIVGLIVTLFKKTPYPIKVVFCFILGNPSGFREERLKFAKFVRH